LLARTRSLGASAEDLTEADKAKATIAANGAENTFVMVQGKLMGNEIAECGLVAQAKAKTEAKERLDDGANDQNAARSAPSQKL
jgi:hypothetical protein